MKLFNYVVLIGCISLLHTTACSNMPQLKCHDAEQILIDSVAYHFDADSVRVSTANIKEEIYFEAIVCPLLEIYNPTTQIIDFKTLPLDSRSLANYDQILPSLEKEAQFIPQWLHENCDLSKFNDIYQS